uniref:CSON015141 protein n=1 Tax=Culicoides sonorensis TaxID=179676 RepID=A0A336MCP6_CULSO
MESTVNLLTFLTQSTVNIFKFILKQQIMMQNRKRLFSATFMIETKSAYSWLKYSGTPHNTIRSKSNNKKSIVSANNAKNNLSNNNNKSDINNKNKIINTNNGHNNKIINNQNTSNNGSSSCSGGSEGSSSIMVTPPSDARGKKILKEAVDAVVNSFAKHTQGYGRETGE